MKISIIKLSFGIIPLVTALMFSFSVNAAGNEQALNNVKALLKADFHQPAREKDKSRRPLKMVEFLGVKPGMTVMDMGAGAGYSTEILSAAVGDEGKVYAQNNQHLVDMADGKIIARLYQRIKEGDLNNVNAVIWEMDDIPLENELDLVFWGNNIHDYYHTLGEQGTLEILQGVKQAMKSGAIFGIVDHVGIDGQDNASLHRIQPGMIADLLKKAGFRKAETSDIYVNPEDNHTLNVFNEGISGQTDRYFIKVVK
ncbi:MAG: hypothetical protein CMI02_10505 [Oceanospirillaceae bacterium]|nr:hypothetical protein [Oceanospirillaceae bacterium]MBT12453.1 hypothetical protein [Oceanospirillaceae bacterium]|tara:strand:- start:16721 stop:17485 length:765 start_codon:yes stop_codon:yes gene_type:complete